MEQISTRAKLHESDIKFVQNLCTFLKSLEYKMNVEIQDIHPKRYYVHVKSPPSFTLDKIKQIDMMSNNIKECLIDFEHDLMKMDMMKHGFKKKRHRDLEAVDIPKHYDLKDVDVHVKKIISHLVAMTEMEFTMDLKKNPLSYDLYLTDIHDVYMRDILYVADTFSAFVDSLEINFPKKQLHLTIKKI